MKQVILCLLLTAVACTQDVKPVPTAATSEEGEKLYVVRGVIMSRNAADNSVSLNHEEIPGFMAAMQMDYVVRGATLDTLPADKSRIEAKLHVTKTGYWITDVKKIP
jgi:hypothetical protein